MSEIVTGNSSIIAPPNLATNGAFLIHQRGFDAGFRAVKNGDSVSDMWKVHATTVDYLEVFLGEGGALQLKGHGKKGQMVAIYNQDIDPHMVIYTDHPYGIPYSTAVGNFRNTGVPIKASVNPKFRNYQATEVYTHRPILKTGEGSQAVTIYDQTFDGVSPYFRASMDFILQEDGEFHVIYSSFAQYAGAYKNPPIWNPVPYADDLARCQRYYQTGDFTTRFRHNRVNTNQSRVGISVPLLGNMATIPTITLTPVSNAVYDGTGNTVSITGTQTIGLENPTENNFTIGGDNNDATHSNNAINNGVVFRVQWIAEVV
jgi:hypothetical protein